MTEYPNDGVRDLIREAHGSDQGAFDVEAGLRDVLARARVPVFAGGGGTCVAERPAYVVEPHWAKLTGRDRHAACMLAARNGDRAAFDALVTDLTPLVWHVARGNGLDRATAEDVVQTVWLALLGHLGRLTEPRALAGWLITTTRREANRVMHAERPVALVELSDPVSSAEDVVLRTDRDRRLWQAFHRLSQRCQELLRLTVLAGRAEYRAVAEALHMPTGSIGPTRGRCLNNLRSLYDGESS
jgi:RNA polymerase sigma factor (sigma-70 family)